MLADGDALGILHIRANAGTQMTDLLLGRAARLGEGLAVTLANMRLRETLTNQSIRDALTGIFNRRYMEESLKRELKRAGRRRYPLTVMMVDLDHFKRLNDSFGHGAGDDVLRGFAQFLATRCRADDVVCRYGGEEFVVIFPEMSAKDAAMKGELLRNAWTQIAAHGGRASTTFSAGFATYPDDATTLEGLLSLADAALYAAKSGGRDRVCGPGEGVCLLPAPQTLEKAS
jgi:diguanylate cyclase (GGDEF)-like protein